MNAVQNHTKTSRVSSTLVRLLMKYHNQSYPLCTSTIFFCDTLHFYDFYIVFTAARLGMWGPSKRAPAFWRATPSQTNIVVNYNL